jgi:enoyl-CoA hydratase/carnithine racemase
MADIKTELRDGIAVVTLNRPAKRNAVTLAMWTQLRRLFEGFATDRDVRAVILTGNGGHFSAGADIGEFDAVRANAALGIAYEREADGAGHAIQQLPKPTAAAIDGACVGGGMALAMACDFRVAGPTARFGIPAARLGIVYGVLDCRNLANLVGFSNAKRILFGGTLFGRDEAQRVGLIDGAADDAPVDAARALLQPMAGNAPLAIAGMKLALNSLADGTVERNLAAIDAAIARSMNSADYREGSRAFLEKREPRFTGA